MLSASLLPDFYLRSLSYKYIISFKEKYKNILKKIFFLIITSPIIFIFISYSLPSLGILNINLNSLMELFNRWNVDFGGNLAVPADTNFIFKYLFFWILPMPIFQSGLGAIIIGISTFSTAFLIICLFKERNFINNYKLKFLFP